MRSIIGILVVGLIAIAPSAFGTKPHLGKLKLQNNVLKLESRYETYSLKVPRSFLRSFRFNGTGIARLEGKTSERRMGNGIYLRYIHPEKVTLFPVKKTWKGTLDDRTNVFTPGGDGMDFYVELPTGEKLPIFATRSQKLSLKGNDGRQIKISGAITKYPRTTLPDLDVILLDKYWFQ